MEGIGFTPKEATSYDVSLRKEVNTKGAYMPGENIGKRNLIIISVLFILLNVFMLSIIESGFNNSTSTSYAITITPGTEIRALIATIICFYMYKGNKWAKDSAVSILLLSGVELLILLINCSNLNMFVLASMYIAMSTFLYKSNSIKVFLRHPIKGPIKT